ncbi:MAG: SirB2 family protein [Sphingomonadaceae bacterium]
MITFYPEIRSVHTGAVMLSGLWMVLRGGALMAGWRWSRGAAAWSISLAIDGTVLTAAAMLLGILPSALFANHWLSVKLVFVTVYFVAGYSAFLSSASRQRWPLLAGAMIAYIIAWGIARAHDIQGWWVILNS